MLPDDVSGLSLSISQLSDVCAARAKKDAKRFAAEAANELLDAEVSTAAKPGGDAGGRSIGSHSSSGKGGQRGRGSETDEALHNSGKRKRSATVAPAASAQWSPPNIGGFQMSTLGAVYNYSKVLSGRKDTSTGASTKGYGGGSATKVAKVASPETRTGTAKPATGGYGGASLASSQHNQAASSNSSATDKARSTFALQTGRLTHQGTVQVADQPQQHSPETQNENHSQAAAASQDSDEEEGEIR